MTNDTTAHNAYTASLAKMAEKGIATVIAKLSRRDWLDTAEVVSEVILHADGRVFVGGTEVTTDAARVAAIEDAQAYFRATGERPEKVMVAVVEEGIARTEAHALHVTLGKLGIRNHPEFAAFVLGRPVPHFTGLPLSDARLIRERALGLHVVAA